MIKRQNCGTNYKLWHNYPFNLKNPYSKCSGCPKTHLWVFFTAAPGFLWLFVCCVQQFTTVTDAPMQMCYSGNIVRKVPSGSPLALHPSVPEEVLAAGTRRNHLLSHHRTGTGFSLPGSICLCGVPEIQAQSWRSPVHVSICWPACKLGWHLLAFLVAAFFPYTEKLHLQAAVFTGEAELEKPLLQTHPGHTLLCSVLLNNAAASFSTYTTAC